MLLGGPVGTVITYAHLVRCFICRSTRHPLAPCSIMSWLGNVVFFWLVGACCLCYWVGLSAHLSQRHTSHVHVLKYKAWFGTMIDYVGELSVNLVCWAMLSFHTCPKIIPLHDHRPLLHICHMLSCSQQGNLL